MQVGGQGDAAWIVYDYRQDGLPALRVWRERLV